MKHASIVLGALFLTAVGVHEATAGLRLARPVAVNTSWAEGNIGTARNSADTRQLLECEVVAWPADRYVSCTAVNASGVVGSCYSRAVPMIENAMALGDSDYVQFGWNKAGECTYLDIFRGSTGEPK
jgi:hypothetical protein